MATSTGYPTPRSRVISAGVGAAITSITYSGGRVTGYTEAGVAYTVGYDGNGRVVTLSDGATTRTVAYNPDGTVASFT